MKRKRMLFGSLTAILVFAMLEIFIRILFNNVPLWDRLPGQSEYHNKMDWLARHRNGQMIFYSYDDHHPRRGWTLRPGVRDVPLQWDERLNANSRGLRGTREIAYEKVANSKRMIVLGDSFVFGDEVSDSETTPAYLESVLPGWEVLNMGIHGYGHDQMLLYFEEEGVNYRPDVVALVFNNVDIDRNMLAFRDYLKPKFVLAENGLTLTNVPIPPPEETLRRYRIGPRLFDLARILADAYIWRPMSPTASAFNKNMLVTTSAIMDKLVQDIRNAGARPLWIFIPVPHELEDFDGRLLLDDMYFLDYCVTRGIPYVSHMPYFVEHMGSVLTPENKGDTHWLAPVNQTVAVRTVREVSRRYPGLLN